MKGWYQPSFSNFKILRIFCMSSLTGVVSKKNHGSMSIGEKEKGPNIPNEFGFGPQVMNIAIERRHANWVIPKGKYY